MQAMRRGKAWGGYSAARGVFSTTALRLAVAVALIGSGCSSISTPLPDIGPTGSTAMSAKDSQVAVEELAKKRDTHQQDAEKEIEQSK